MNTTGNTTPAEAFSMAIAASGMQPPEAIIPGVLQRFSPTGRHGDTAGWYVFYSDGIPAGSFGNWREATQSTWCSKADHEMTDTEREAHHQRMQAAQQQREAAKAAQQEATAQVAQTRWDASQPATGHPYLTAKGIKPHAARIDGEILLIPLRDVRGKLWNLQQIYPDGTKRFLPGGKVSGCYCAIGQPDGALVIAEGFATGASIHEATGRAVVVAFSASNLPTVALALRARYPDMQLTIAADDDHQTAGNPGLTKGTQAAQAVGGWLARPVFPPERADRDTDFNDLARLAGAEAVVASFQAAVYFGPEQSQANAATSTPESTPDEVLKSALERLKKDVGVQAEPDVVQAFAALRSTDLPNYLRYREAAKAANRALSLRVLDEQVRKALPECGNDQNDATTLVNLASERCQLWHDKEHEAYATLQRDESDGRSHFEHWAIESTGFREWLSWLAHSELGRAHGNDTLSAARNALQGKAKFDGETHQHFKRVAKDEQGYWIDLCDDQWRAILVTASGWKIYEKPSVRFTRTKAMRPLPTPLPGGNCHLLWDMVNIPEEDRQLALAWILEAYRCDTPYAVLELIGEQGSAKSGTQQILRDLIDPNQVALRGKPKSVEDVFVAATNNHLVSLENLSGITSDMSDALCTIATGGGTAGRTLYTNGEESILQVHNPVVMNGIGAVITRNDLLDRAIALCLPTIKDRRTEKEMDAQFERHAPSIFGGLLDLFAETLVNLVNVKINPSELPRMADFAILGEAMHMAQGFAPGEWLKLYKNHRRDAIRRTIESSPVAAQCLAFIDEGRNYNGTVKGLLETLTDRMDAKSMEHGEYWPRSPKGFADALRRAAPALRQLGISVSVDSKARNDGVHCHLRRTSEHDGGHGNQGYMSVRATQNNRNQSSPSSPSSPQTVETEGFEL